MNSPLLTFFVCLSCFTLPYCKPDPDPSQVQRVNSELLDPQNTQVLTVALIAASIGRHLFEMPKSVTEDCVRTANATYELAGRPSTFENSKSLISSTINTTQNLGSASGSEYAIEVLCSNLNIEFKKKVADFPNFEQLKKDLVLPKPAKNYYINIYPQATVSQMMTQFMNDLQDPAFVKVVFAETLLSADTKVARVGADLAAVPKAIRELAKSESFRSTVDGAFEQLLDEYVTKVYSENTPMQKKFDTDCYPYLKTIDEYFLQIAALKEEYAKIKKQIIDKMGEPKKE